ncbi:unnamed protein product [Rhizoctonia solani]|uniref:Uncharacterized protein n=1 Tax=Rhizoctonia solani TaxID=456999 RepID=A0A8H2ZZ97_9AGAM|nr:unnamed protein product [Rhizoctonia solani]
MGCIPSKPPAEPTAPSASKAALKTEEAPVVSNTPNIPAVTLHEATPIQSRKSTELLESDKKKVKDTGVGPDGSTSGAGTGATAAGAIATGGNAAAESGGGGGAGGDGGGGGGD